MIIVITGPTCTSKSKIAIDVAKYFDAEIINADAFQVYKELNIGTAKPSDEDLKKVKHHLYSYLKPTDKFSIYDYQIDARKIINKLIKEKKNIVLVGGSGLYIRSVLYDFKFNDNNASIDLSKFEKLSDIELYKELEKIDKVTANKIHPNNRRRVLRAIYIYYAYGKSKSEIEASQNHKIIYKDVHIYAVDLDREILYKRIDKRVENMISNGLIDEVNSLKKKYDNNLQSLKAIGYKEIIDNPKMNKSELISLIQKNTRHYAKKQLTFIRYQYKNSFKWIKSSKDIINDLTKDDMDSRTEALVGKENLKKIKKVKVAIFGIGGVGGTAAEALIRSGVQSIYLIDHDKVNASNLNRQLLFISKDIGKDKVKVAKQYLNQINPKAKIYTYKKYFDKDHIKDIPFDKFDYVIDAIDSTESKITLIEYLLKKNIPFISSLGMGNRTDLTKVDITTLDKTHDDPLAKKIRNKLNKDGINLAKVNVVTSIEIPLKDKNTITSMIFVPSTAGLLLANYIISLILNKNKKEL